MKNGLWNLKDIDLAVLANTLIGKNKRAIARLS